MMQGVKGMKGWQGIKRRYFLTALMIGLIVTVLLGATVFAENITAFYGTQDYKLTSTSDSPIELQWYLRGNEPDGFDRVAEEANAYIKRKLGVKVNFHFLDDESYELEKDRLIESGETVDIMFVPNLWSYKEDISKGCYLSLDELLDQYAPKTKEILGEVLKCVEVGGKIYGLPVITGRHVFASGISFRSDLLKKYNISVGHVKKLEDVEPILKLIKEKEPSVIPFVYGSFELSYNALNLTPLDDNADAPGVLRNDEKEIKIYNEFTLPETMDYLKTLYRFSRLEFIDVPHDTDTAKEQGMVFAELHGEMNPLHNEESEYEWTNVYFGEPVIGNSAVETINAVSASSKYPEKALELQELINTDRYLTNLFHFGIEGEHYVKVSENVIDTNESTSEYLTDLNRMIGNRYLDYTRKSEDPDKYADLKAFNDRATASKTLGFKYDFVPVFDEDLACWEVKFLHLAMIYVGAYDPEEYLPIMNDALIEAGVEKVIAEKQRQYQEWLSAKSMTDPDFAFPGIRVFLGGELLPMTHEPFLVEGELLALAEPVLDSMNVFWEYDPETQTLSAQKEAKRFKLTVGSNTAECNGEQAKLAVLPEMKDGQVYIPMEFVCQAFGYTYHWDEEKQTAHITSENVAEGRGNSFGNICNGGYVAEDEDWVYVSLYNMGLYKIRKDGSKRVKLSSYVVSNLNVKDGWVYYVNPPDARAGERSRLYRMKTDGTGKKRLVKDEVSFVNVVGDWIYYINLSDDNKPYKVSTDEKHRQKLSDHSLQSLLVEDGWMYFQKTDNHVIYKMRTSGTDMKRLTDLPYPYYSFINKDGEWLYYYFQEDDGSGIYRMKTDGSSKEKILGVSVVNMNCADGFIYFTDSLGNLHKVNAESHIRTKIGSNIEGSIGIADDWIYYTRFSKIEEDLKDEAEYRIRTDGMIKQRFGKNATLKNVFDMTSMKDSMMSKPIVLPDSPPQTTLKTVKEISKYKEAVVQIKAYDEDGEPIASGSGFIIRSDGVVVTNFHVIDGALSIECILDNQQTYEVEYLLNFNQLKDIAILKLKGAQNLPVVHLGDSDGVELADEVVAIGNPLGLQNSVSVGIVSGFRSMLGVSHIQTTASISNGSSGGPLFNMYGEVIGITTLTVADAQNINFAVPVNMVKKLFSTARVIPIAGVSIDEAYIIEWESNDDIGTSNEIALDRILAGMVDKAGDIDYYKLELSEDTEITVLGSFDFFIDQQDAAKELEMVLLDENGHEIAASTVVNLEGSYLKQIAASLKEGTYFIAVKKAGVVKDSSDMYMYSVAVVSK